MAAETTNWLVRASDLKRRHGWSETSVVALLGAPDALSPNPHGFRAPMRWYREDRVRDAEASQVFRERAERIAARADDPTPPTRPAPLRLSAPDTIDHLEWLDDAAHLALFHTPRRPRMRRPRRPVPQPVAIPAGQRFEVLRLF